MCWIGVFPPGTMPSREVLEKAAEPNTDGAGYAIAAPSRLVTGRDLASGLVIPSFLDDRRAMPLSWAAIHFRLSTAEPVTRENLHPVDVPGCPDTAVLHNGTMPDWLVTPGTLDTLSFARMLGGMIRQTQDKEAQAPPVPLLERLIGPGNKVVIMTGGKDPGRYPCYVLNRGQWLTQPGGWLASNADHLGKGTGWDELDVAGRLYRYSLPQPGQCGRCNLMGHDETHCNGERATVPYRWRQVRNGGWSL